MKNNQIKSFQDKYDFLSNFYPVNIIYNGIEYPSVEHAYQAQKTLDENERLRISFLSSASESKKEGKKLNLRKDWYEVRVPIMKDLLVLKFRNEELKEKLLATGDSILIEGNWWNDTFWGICNGVGSNMLGVLLIYIRHCIKYE